MANFTDAETEAMQSYPGVLRALAEWHQTQAVMADGMDMRHSAEYHNERSRELLGEAKQIEAAY